MTNDLRIASRRWWKVILAGLLITLIGAMVFIYAPVVESRYWPILTDSRLLELNRKSPTVVEFRMIYHKHRACTVISQHWFGLDAEGRYTFASVRFLDNLSGLTNRPVGINVSREIELTTDPTAIHLVGIFLYRCGLPWLSRASVGPFPLTSAAVGSATIPLALIVHPQLK